ncbi:Germin-like protein subfamily 3 member 4 [Camellia lanceoleosa]|uniref:Germin-like protein subfamily 3 member 4 n=1 Tax=Camellia lanceoleosa TaxID=1840588 RepID=A0ACC0F7X9_9ERIC|nr:Germin-like protein subfamily 3 member 4 [Camellia lanceoleosa]
MVRTCLLLLLCIAFSSHYLSVAFDSDNLQDTCPAATLPPPTTFFNGFPCKNPATVTASDFKSSSLSQAGDTSNIPGSSTAIFTAADFPGLNTLGLSVARTDIDVDGLVMPHYHPRASEMLFLSKGVVTAGFTDSQNKIFLKEVRKGDVFVFPRGLVHYCLNMGSESAVGFSVLNSQNPGLVGDFDSMFVSEGEEVITKLKKRLVSLSALQMDRVENGTFFGF